jgi:hypothetical protein
MQFSYLRPDRAGSALDHWRLGTGNWQRRYSS